MNGTSDYRQPEPANGLVRLRGRRTAICLLLMALAAGFAAYLAGAVPVQMSRLPANEATRYWRTAAAGAAFVAIIAGMVFCLALRRRGRARTGRSPALYAFFLAITVLQLGHMGEHTVQVTQLLLTHGDLARAHGAFGQLDFETVHFVWDSLVWLTLAVLLYNFPRNPWLWLAFAVAGVHEVEHLYLYWVFLADKSLYMRGGLAGVLGRGGVIGSPLARPYLHFLYNVLVVGPTLLAFWHQTAQAYERRTRLYDLLPAGAFTAYPAEALRAAREQLPRIPVRYL